VAVVAVQFIDRGGPDRLLPVAGRVFTTDGAPLPRGTIKFSPDRLKGNLKTALAGYVPQGTIDADGHYEVYTRGKRGAPPGWYKVVIDAFGPDGAMLNNKYYWLQLTDLVVEVVEQPSPEAYDFRVEKAGRPPAAAPPAGVLEGQAPRP
jgi:hypothetical protein